MIWLLELRWLYRLLHRGVLIDCLATVIHVEKIRVGDIYFIDELMLVYITQALKLQSPLGLPWPLMTGRCHAIRDSA